MTRPELFRSIDHKMCIMSVALIVVLFLSGFTLTTTQVADPVTGQSWWAHNADAVKWLVWALFGYMVWSVRRLLEKLEKSIESLEKRVHQMEEKLTEIVAEHEIIISRGGH